jgi:hypothetical protein
MKAEELAVSRRDSWRKISIALINCLRRVPGIESMGPPQRVGFKRTEPDFDDSSSFPKRRCSRATWRRRLFGVGHPRAEPSIGEKSPLRSSTRKKANKKRTLVLWPGFNSRPGASLTSGTFCCSREDVLFEIAEKSQPHLAQSARTGNRAPSKKIGQLFKKDFPGWFLLKDQVVRAGQ